MELCADNGAALEAHLQTLGWLGNGEKVRALTPAGDGNMNRTLRVSLDTRSIVLKQSVPFVAKYPDIPAPLDRLAVEAGFYASIRRAPAVARRMPALIGHDPASNLLCLEDLGPAVDYTRLYGPAAAADDVPGAELIEWLAALHAMPLDDLDRATFENAAMRALNHEHIFRLPLDPANDLALDPALDDIRAALAADRALRERAAALGAIYLGTRQAGNSCLLHGDFYPGSWLCDPERGVMVIDPEFCFIGPAEFDVGVMLAHLTFTGLAPRERDAILADYAAPAGFDGTLCEAFAGMEVIRRLLGVAQLPLVADADQRIDWLAAARCQVLQ